MKRIAVGIVLSLLLSGLILWASNMAKIAFVGSGLKDIDDHVLTEFMSTNKDAMMIIIDEKEPDQIIKRIREIRPVLILAVSNATLEKLKRIDDIPILAVVEDDTQPPSPPKKIYETGQIRI